LDIKLEVQESLKKATQFVTEGMEQILEDNLDQDHGVSPSPGATALASLALLALGKEFKAAQQRGIQWLWQNYQGGGWGKVPDGPIDEEITKIARLALQGSQGGMMTKLKILSQARQFSQMILSLGQKVVPGLEGPTPEEIVLPNILEEKVLRKLPLYGRPVVVAAAMLATDSQEALKQGAQYLLPVQMEDGSWSEDIIATSLAILALMRLGSYQESCQKAGYWLLTRQYNSGGWPAFDQLKNWAMGWALCIFSETANLKELPWLEAGVHWLRQAQNADGSYGSTPPYTHPDLDDTAVALLGLKRVGMENPLGFNYLRRLQNEDGSWSTFPNFQGVPPQIASEFPVYITSVDVTIHVLEALWRPRGNQEEAFYKGLKWLLTQQQKEGEYPASWYEGNIYSTAQSLELLGKWKFHWKQLNLTRQIFEARQKALNYILANQQADGGWGSVVETGLALSSVLLYSKGVPREVFDQGIKHLLQAQAANGSFKPSYRAIYAKGWNYEEPIATALTALRAYNRYLKLYPY